MLPGIHRYGMLSDDQKKVVDEVIKFLKGKSVHDAEVLMSVIGQIVSGSAIVNPELPLSDKT